MAFQPIKIPQNVYVEDRVIGPITLRQIFMLLGGGGVSYVLWSVIKTAGYINIIAGSIALIPTIIMVLFAFVKISEISLFRFCILLIEQSQKPSIRYWQPRTGIQIHFQQATDAEEEASRTPVPQKQISEVDALSSVLDSQVLEKKKTPISSPK
jgi:hypothetical protein